MSSSQPTPADTPEQQRRSTMAAAVDVAGISQQASTPAQPPKINPNLPTIGALLFSPNNANMFAARSPSGVAASSHLQPAAGNATIPYRSSLISFVVVSPPVSPLFSSICCNMPLPFPSLIAISDCRTLHPSSLCVYIKPLTVGSSIFRHFSFRITLFF